MASINDILIINRAEVAAILLGKEHEIIDIVTQAYKLHDEGKTSVPHSTFLRIPDQPRDRIIGLPAYIGGDDPVAGMKWVASFPENLEKDLERASATIIINDTVTGRPTGIVEGSLVNAARTAASAALGAKYISGNKSFSGLTQVGCGPINREILRFMMCLFDDIRFLYLYDLDIERAERYAKEVRASYPNMNVNICEELAVATRAADLVVFGTTAPTPYIDDVSYFQPGATILNISLRDIGADIVRGAINVVDDADHVNRENTSIHLASEKAGNTDFIFANIGYILRNPDSVISLADDVSRLRIYSPFGLGVLDIATAQYILRQASANGVGTRIARFLEQ